MAADEQRDHLIKTDELLPSPLWLSSLQCMEQWLTRLGKVATHVFALSTMIGFLTGAIILIAYVRVVGAAVPVLSGSFVNTLVVMTAMYALLLASGIFSLLVVPISHWYIWPESILFSSRHSKLSFTKYACLFAPYLLLAMFFISPAIGLGVIPVPTWAGPPTYFGIGWLLSAVSMKILHPKEVTRSDYFLPPMASFFGSVWLSSASMLVTISFSSWVAAMPEGQRRFIDAGLFGFILLLHYVLNRAGKPKLGNVLASVSFAWFSILLFFPARAGEITLRALGVGGGLPIIVQLDKPVITNEGGKISSVTACLIIDGGDEIWIAPTSRRDDCRIWKLLALREWTKPGKGSPLPVISVTR